MFVVLLRFSAQKERAVAFMEAHKLWIKQGFDDGCFLLTGSLASQGGGAVIAHGLSRTELEARLEADPFVREGIVTAEIVEITPSRVVPPLDALLP